jgi:serine protease SohB
MKLKIPFLPSKPTVAVVKMSGVISAGARSGLCDQTLSPILEKAFKKGQHEAVALLINSPGGSPVQSSLISSRVKRLAKENQMPVYAFVEDVAASGGYWLACSADEIYADTGSIIGSIGVISAGFGFQELIDKYGVERRVHTAGKSKSMLDPFKKESPEDIKRLKRILSEMHELFITYVEKTRGGKLTQKDDIFTGEIWLGEKAKELGLIDGIGHLDNVMKEKFGNKTRIKIYGQKKNFLQRFGVNLINEAGVYLEERAAFSRFGL